MFTLRRVALLAVAAAAAGLLLAWQLGARPPAWYPPCVFHAATGLHCPGCGSSRAVHAALHGEWLRALHDNALLLLFAPALAVRLGQILWFALRHDRRAPPLQRRYSLTVFVAVAAFWLLRNLPFPPGPWLAPLPNAVSARPAAGGLTLKSPPPPASPVARR